MSSSFHGQQTDVASMVEWHADDDVARYRDGKTFARETMLLRLARERLDMFLVPAARLAQGPVRGGRNPRGRRRPRLPWMLMELGRPWARPRLGAGVPYPVRS